jgi:uncharacterized protein YdcH (DUF465 family)
MESVAGHARGIVDAGILAEGMKLELELNAANDRIKLLEAANSDVARIAAERDKVHERIKRLEEAGDAMLNAWLMPEDSMEYCDWVALSADAKIKWQLAKEVKP